MNPSYEDLINALHSSARKAAGELGKASGHPDLGQGAAHLSTVLEMLDNVDPEVPEPADEDAVLSQAAAIADQVCAQVVDGTDDPGVMDALTALEEDVSMVQQVGYIAPAPENLEWFNDSVPVDGTEF